MEMKMQSQPILQPFQRSLRQQLVDAIGGEIVGGHLQPGDSLPSEDILLARYGVSRTVLREALNVLFGKGLLDARPKRGTIVRPRADWNQLDSAVLSWLGAGDPANPEGRDNLDDLMEIRRIIEPSAAALAAQRGTPEDIQRMADAYAAMEQAGDIAESFMQADLAFHVACLHAAHNDFLLPVANAIRTAMMTSLQVTNRDAEQNRLALPLHRTILAAVRARDPDAAALAMEHHLNDTQARRVAAGRRPLSNSPTT
jgi:DNA-binding FadR family transcriptional regulator